MIKYEIIKNIKKSTILPVSLVLILLMVINAIIQPSFFSFRSFSINASSFTPMILAAMAQGVVILLGFVDLSIGASITLINVVMATIMKDTGASVALALLVGVAVGLLIGIVNGFVVGVLRLPAIVATFGTSSVWFGIALIIMPQPGGYVPPFFYRLYRTSLVSIPAPLLIVFFALFIWWIITRRPLVRYLYAVGGNEAASDASGIHITKVKIQAFMLSGFFSSLAAIAITCQAASGDASIGAPFTLQSIAAVILGGIVFRGGKGRMIGAVAGAMVFGFLSNVIFFASIPSLYQELISGILIILALVVAVLPNLKSSMIAGGE